MSNKKSILDTPKTMVFKALDKTKKVVITANGYALHKTEDIVSEGIVVIEQWQTVGNKALKGSLSLAATNQDLVFDALTGIKKHMILSKKRFSKLIA
ncbi:MAG: hypothetical protein ACJARX_001844 [Psychroserpens sp.]|jgi:hypothetical protein|uniref:hypothetical protein n=1 Tax=Psychroserpens sp. TaxID=2020870 RepID=UPI0039E34169